MVFLRFSFAHFAPLRFKLLFVLLALLVGCKRPQAPVAAMSALPAALPPRAYLLHIPGVSGESRVDHTLIAGFREGQLDADIEIYDWTEHDTGIPALQAMERHQRQARIIADKLTARFRADPRITIYLTSHSGGIGLAVWALEDLPADVMLERAVFLSPALSPGYDLSKALRHVRDKAYVFWSGYDTVVLSVGTRAFGTIDGVYTDAAGYVGFKQPPRADPKQYAKLVQFPYDPAWMRLGNDGDHIGTTATPFSRDVLVPVLAGNAAATRPSVEVRR